MSLQHQRIKIKMDLLRMRVSNLPDSFIGRIGGDDFIILLPADLVREVSEKIVQRFDKGIVNLSFSHYKTYLEVNDACVEVKTAAADNSFNGFPPWNNNFIFKLKRKKRLSFSIKFNIIS